MYLIAEIGTNHNGNRETARKLVKAAIECGVQAVKMNYWKADLLVAKESDWYSRAKELELPLETLAYCSSMCAERDVDFIVAPWSHELVSKVSPIADKFKIASGELTNKKLLEACKASGKRTILSTGMANMDEIISVFKVFQPEVIMHCVSLYPTRDNQVNLNGINLLRLYSPEIKIGYSDHTTDTLACIAAYSRGAEVIEKHFNIYKNRCRDEAISMHQNATKYLVHKLERIDCMASGDATADYVNRDKLRRGESGLRE